MNTPESFFDSPAFLDLPAMPAPPGMDHNFVNPSNDKNLLHGMVLFCLVISTLAVGIRMWTVARVIRKVDLEDWICCLALVSFVAFCAVVLGLERKYKSGAHQWNIRIGELSYYLYYVWIGTTMYFIVNLLIKLAILVQYLRIFVAMKKRNWMYWTCHTLIWLSMACYGLLFLFRLFTCTPVKKFWRPWISGNCFDEIALNFVAITINTVSDVIVVVVPQPIIWNLQISTKRKVGLSAIILVGILACVCSGIRLHYVVKLSHSTDGTYYVFLIGLYSYLEMAFGIVAACSTVTPKFFQSLRNSHPGLIFNNFLRSTIYSKTDSSTPGTRSDKSKASKLGDGSGNFHAKLTNYKSLPDEIELALQNSEGQIKHQTGRSQALQIMRTVHISTTHEVKPESAMPDLENQTFSTSYGYH